MCPLRTKLVGSLVIQIFHIIADINPLLINLSHHAKLIHFGTVMVCLVGEDDADVGLHLLGECGEIDILSLHGESIEQVEGLADEDNLALEYIRDIDNMVFDDGVGEEDVNGVVGGVLDTSLLRGQLLGILRHLERLEQRVAIDIDHVGRG